MQLRRLLTEEDAVSPVIGVVLLVAIAVAMMTAIGAFVLGVGPGEQPPRTDLVFEQDGSDVTIKVATADGLAEEDVEVTVEDQNACAGSDVVWDGSGPIDVGDSVTIDGKDSGDCSGSPSALDSDDRIRVIWEADSGGRTEILERYSVI